MNGKDPYKALVVSLKATGRNKEKLTNVTIVMKKLADFIIINVKQVFKSIKIYLIKHKLLSHLSLTIVIQFLA